jgi:hypothetical protein
MATRTPACVKAIPCGSIKLDAVPRPSTKEPPPAIFIDTPEGVTLQITRLLLSEIKTLPDGPTAMPEAINPLTKDETTASGVMRTTRALPPCVTYMVSSAAKAIPQGQEN